MPAYKSPGYYGFKVIGTLKLLSGLIAIVAGLSALRFLAHQPGPKLERAFTHLGIDTQNHLIHAVIAGLTGLSQTRLRALQAGTFFYAILHSLEGIGLILEKTWAGYLVVIATSTLVPFEIYEIASKPTALRFSLFFLNVGLVIYLIVTLRKEHAERAKNLR